MERDMAMLTLDFYRPLISYFDISQTNSYTGEGLLKLQAIESVKVYDLGGTVAYHDDIWYNHPFV